MRSPPCSDMFLSSPPRLTGTNPQGEAEALFAVASKVISLEETISAAINSSKQAFFSILSRQIRLLKSRSQAFEDGHVTVYDKVLLSLTKNGNDLENPAAITWYCNEYLGFHGGKKNDQDDLSLQQTLKVEAAISQDLSAPGVQPQISLCARTTADNTSNPQKSSISSRDDPVFKRLWSVYSKAHADYLIIAEKRDNETLNAVKFLRDTAENGIHFLQGKYPDDPALTELTNTYKMAKSAAVELHGGRKRKFDHHVDRDNVNKNKKQLPHVATHDRVNAARRHQRRDSKGAKPHKIGRGPSGIPYGYTRPVDSYYPA